MFVPLGLIPRELGQLKALENAWFFGNNLSGGWFRSVMEEA